jgi:group I intron endonuclease
MAKICGVYEIINTINNKKYIGQSIDIYRRWKDHQCKLQTNSHNNEYLQRAWNKYGEENFEFKICEVCSEDKLDERECFYIKEYQTCNQLYGYNLKDGGGHHDVSEEARLHMSQAHVNQWTEERRKEMRIKYSGEKNPFYGKKHTEETRRKIAEANKLRVWSEKSKQKMRDRMTGSVSPNRGKTVPQEVRDKISASLKGKPSPRSEPVIQLDKELNYIATFDSVQQAMDATGISRRKINACRQGIIENADGYTWRNKEDFCE